MPPLCSSKVSHKCFRETQKPQSSITHKMEKEKVKWNITQTQLGLYFEFMVKKNPQKTRQTIWHFIAFQYFSNDFWITLNTHRTLLMINFKCKHNAKHIQKSKMHFSVQHKHSFELKERKKTASNWHQQDGDNFFERRGSIPRGFCSIRNHGFEISFRNTILPANGLVAPVLTAYWGFA